MAVAAVEMEASAEIAVAAACSQQPGRAAAEAVEEIQAVSKVAAAAGQMAAGVAAVAARATVAVVEVVTSVAAMVVVAVAVVPVVGLMAEETTGGVVREEAGSVDCSAVVVVLLEGLPARLEESTEAVAGVAAAMEPEEMAVAARAAGLGVDSREVVERVAAKEVVSVEVAEEGVRQVARTAVEQWAVVGVAVAAEIAAWVATQVVVENIRQQGTAAGVEVEVGDLLAV